MEKKLFRTTLTGVFALVLAVSPAFAQNTEIQLSSDAIGFNGNGGTQEVKVLKGKGFVVFNRCDWMKYDFSGNTIKITAEPYNHFYPRKTSIILTSKKTNYSKVLEISQKSNNRPDVLERPTENGLSFLTDMDLSKCKTFYIPSVRKNVSVDGNKISLKGTYYKDGVETHAPSTMIFRINGATRFRADIGIDDEIILRNSPDQYGDADVEISIDGKTIKKGHIKMKDMDILPIDIDLKGGKYLAIRFTTDDTGGDHIAIGNGRFNYSGSQPVAVTEEEMNEGLNAQKTAFASPTSNPNCKAEVSTFKSKITRPSVSKNIKKKAVRKKAKK